MPVASSAEEAGGSDDGASRPTPDAHRDATTGGGFEYSAARAASNPWLSLREAAPPCAPFAVSPGSAWR